jgi:membrane protein implicated in regulation of membrane protease activity
MDTIRDFLRPEVVWFLVGLFLLVLELSLPGLIIGFFGVGAWVVAIVCLMTDIGINTQLIIFIAASVLSLLLLRKWVKAVFLGHAGAKQDLRHDHEDFVGQQAVVKEKIVPKSGGKVEFHGSHWEAQADQEIAEGTIVEIVGKDNITFKVKAL